MEPLSVPWKPRVWRQGRGGRRLSGHAFSPDMPRLPGSATRVSWSFWDGMASTGLERSGSWKTAWLVGAQETQAVIQFRVFKLLFGNRTTFLIFKTKGWRAEPLTLLLSCCCQPQALPISQMATCPQTCSDFGLGRT